MVLTIFQNHPETPVITYESTFVAFLQILGYKETACGYSHDELVGLYHNVISPNVGMNLSKGVSQLVDLPEGKRVAILDSSNYEINSILISDNIILWSNDDSYKSFISIIVCVRNILINNLYARILTRGSIVVGPLTFQRYNDGSSLINANLILIGRALVEAYKSQENTAWIGCNISETAINVYEHQMRQMRLTSHDVPDLPFLQSQNLLVKYNVPCKQGEVDQWVVNWPYGNTDWPSTDIVKDAISGHKKKPDDSLMQSIFINTVKFLNFVRPQTNLK